MLVKPGQISQTWYNVFKLVLFCAGHYRIVLNFFQNIPYRVRKPKNTNGVQFRHRMTKNRHKRRQRPKLLFQQTEFSEPIDLVSQHVHPVEGGSKNLSEPSLKSQESKKINKVENQLQMIENQHKRRLRSKLLF